MLEVDFGVKILSERFSYFKAHRELPVKEFGLGERWFEGSLEILQQFISHFSYGKISPHSLKPSWKQQEVGPTWMCPGCSPLFFIYVRIWGLWEVSRLGSWLVGVAV